MRLAGFMSFALTLLLTGAASAQSSPPFYINREWRFAIIFPAEPVAKDIVYTAGSGASFRGRQFSVEQDGNRHLITVVHAPQGPAIDNAMLDRAADELRKRGEVRFQAADDYDPGLPGRQLNIFQPNGRQLRASVYMWEHYLYITEADGVPGTSSLLQFEQSVTLLNADGSEVNLGF